MIETERLIGQTSTASDQLLEPSIRPKKLEDYQGQPRVVEQLSVAIEAARGRQEALDHVLISGPPGLGKTTLSHIIAHEMHANLKQTSGPAVEKAGDLAAILTNLQQGDVLFIDEIHRLHTSVEEVLYSAMEDFQLDIIIGEGPAARSIKLDIPPFTLVGATTRTGLLTSPLRDRFGIVQRLQFYQPEDLQRIIERSAHVLNMRIANEASWEIARRSRGTPRIANRLLRRVRDYAEVEQNDTITQALADRALSALDISGDGLDSLDRQLLGVIVERFDGGPVGLDTLAATLGEARDTLEDVVEPYLIQNGYLARTPRGRIAGPEAYQALGHPTPQGGHDEP